MKATHLPRMALIGCGRFGLNHLRVYHQLLEEGRLASLSAVDSSPAARRRVKKQFKIPVYAELQNLLRDERPHAVSVATPDPFHRKVAVQAANAGCHLLVEKPLATSTRDAQAILETAREKKRLLQVDFHKRYDPTHTALRDEVQSGKLGEILYGYVHMEDRIEVARDWFGPWVEKSSSNWFLGVHFYDLVRWVIGRNPVSVRATRQSKKLKSLGINSPDSVQAHVSFKGGAEVTFQTSWILPDNFEAIVNQGVRLVGTEGLIEVDTQDRGSRMASAKDAHQRTISPGFLREALNARGQKVLTGFGTEPILQFAENVSMLLNGASLHDLEGSYPSGEDGLWATRMAEAADSSCRQKGAVIRLGK